MCIRDRLRFSGNNGKQDDQDVVGVQAVVATRRQRSGRTFGAWRRHPRAHVEARSAQPRVAAQ
eukprot:13835771-Heterocapsa_arctica.AAC.1